jgi:hypothetical protein
MKEKAKPKPKPKPKPRPTSRRLLNAGWIAAALCLAGCGAAVRRPGVPIDQPLTPVAIYLQPCLQEPPKRDDALAGELLCRSLPFALQAELTGRKLDYRLIPASGGDGESVTPDRAMEQSMGAHYRLIVERPTSSLVTSAVGPDQAPYSITSHLEAFVGLRIENVQSDAPVGTGLIHMLVSRDLPAAFARRIVNGLTGPRCESVNRWSLAGAFHSSFGAKCESFSIDDDSDLSKNPFRNLFGAGKSKDEQ